MKNLILIFILVLFGCYQNLPDEKNIENNISIKVFTMQLLCLSYRINDVIQTDSYTVYPSSTHTIIKFNDCPSCDIMEIRLSGNQNNAGFISMEILRNGTSIAYKEIDNFFKLSITFRVNENKCE